LVAVGKKQYNDDDDDNNNNNNSLSFHCSPRRYFYKYKIGWTWSPHGEWDEKSIQKPAYHRLT